MQLLAQVELVHQPRTKAHELAGWHVLGCTSVLRKQHMHVAFVLSNKRCSVLQVATMISVRSISGVPQQLYI